MKRNRKKPEKPMNNAGARATDGPGVLLTKEAKVLITFIASGELADPASPIGNAVEAGPLQVGLDLREASILWERLGKTLGRLP